LPQDELPREELPREELFLEKKFSFDHHSKLISRVLRRPQILTSLATPESLFPILGILASPWSTLHHQKKENKETDVA
jgi:hypothetical protein